MIEGAVAMGWQVMGGRGGQWGLGRAGIYSAAIIHGQYNTIFWPLQCGAAAAGPAEGAPSSVNSRTSLALRLACLL